MDWKNFPKTRSPNEDTPQEEKMDVRDSVLAMSSVALMEKADGVM